MRMQLYIVAKTLFFTTCNHRVCSHHFIEQDFVSGAIEGFGPKRLTFKPEAVPTVLFFQADQV